MTISFHNIFLFINFVLCRLLVIFFSVMDYNFYVENCISNVIYILHYTFWVIYFIDTIILFYSDITMHLYIKETVHPKMKLLL